MKLPSLVLLCVMVFLQLACHKASTITEGDLVGRWEIIIDLIDVEPSRQGFIEYYEDGTWTRTMPKGQSINGLHSWSGEWRIREDKRLEISVDFNGEGEHISVYEMEFLGKDIVISDKDRGLRERCEKQ